MADRREVLTGADNLKSSVSTEVTQALDVGDGELGERKGVKRWINVFLKQAEQILFSSWCLNSRGR